LGHSLTVPSFEQEATNLPVELKSTQFTCALWPLYVKGRTSGLKFHTLISRS